MLFASAAALVVACSPNISAHIADLDLEGPGGVKLQQRRAAFTVELIGADGKVIWKQKDWRLPSREVQFSPDGRTLALDGGSFEVLIIEPSGNLKRVKLNKELTSAEHALIPKTYCGTVWLESMRFATPSVVEVSVKQDGVPPLRFAIDLSMKVATIKRE
ncbi:MAG: hypothetical protein JNM17_40150 [Archangium sp.]|nr:hypothetical protein [Archangium sp.]